MHDFKQLIYLASLLSFFWSANCASSDGVLEINHACAVNGGCFNGDSAGYPITIDGSAGGSYQLTSNLIVPDKDTSGISVNAPSISINLNGFEILRSGCEGATTDCTPESGSGSGVLVTASSNFGVSVKNGSITGMGNYGVFLGRQGEAKGLRLRWNRNDGIFADQDSIVTHNSAYENGGNGILVLADSIISGNIAKDNGGIGIAADSGSKVRGNTSSGNASPDNCGGGICSERRRYYLTLTERTGDAALTSCSEGFHMASLWEIFDTSNLQYDTGRGAGTRDSGGGPPAGTTTIKHGWVRTGANAWIDNGTGLANCSAWASNSNQEFYFGTAVTPWNYWDDLEKPSFSRFNKWEVKKISCTSSQPVWCIED